MTNQRLRFGIAPPNWGPTGDPRTAGELARAAEESGWDGYFTWDALVVADQPPPVFDPFVILSSVAIATKRIRIGTCVLIPARYQPHLLALRLASLDILSEGRLTVGVGLGDGGQSFEVFGEPGDASVRAEKLDEALEVMRELWTGRKLTHHGKHYQLDGFTLNPVPAQPRIPIWVGGDSPGALRRAARWDGWIGPDNDPLEKTVTDLTAVRRSLDQATPPGRRVDVAWAGQAAPADEPDGDALRNAGATWRIEVLIGTRDEVFTTVRDGPPG